LIQVIIELLGQVKIILEKRITRKSVVSSRVTKRTELELGRLSQRRLIKSVSMCTAGLLFPSSVFSQNYSQFNQLKIPPQLLGTARSGQQHYSLDVQTGESEFIPGLRTPTIGFNGNYLGPTLRFQK